MSEVALSKPEVAEQLVQHLHKGIVNSTVFMHCRDPEWMRTFIYLFNLHLRAQEEQ